MAETAALLADEVLPARPLRQWVLWLPLALRCLFVTDPDSLAVVLSTVLPEHVDERRWDVHTKPSCLSRNHGLSKRPRPGRFEIDHHQLPSGRSICSSKARCGCPRRFLVPLRRTPDMRIALIAGASASRKHHLGLELSIWLSRGAPRFRRSTRNLRLTSQLTCRPARMKRYIQDDRGQNQFAAAAASGCVSATVRLTGSTAFSDDHATSDQTRCLRYRPKMGYKLPAQSVSREGQPDETA